MYYLKLFFTFCFIGFMFESLGAIFLGTNFNSSVLYGPWTTVYGLGIFVMLFTQKFIQKYLPKLTHKKYFEIIIFFILSALLLTLLEYLSGLLIYEKLHIIYWDYQNMHFQYNEFNCLEATLFWGIASTIIIYGIYPYLKKLITKIPNFFIIIILFLYLIDGLYFILT